MQYMRFGLSYCTSVSANIPTSLLCLGPSGLSACQRSSIGTTRKRSSFGSTDWTGSLTSQKAFSQEWHSGTTCKSSSIPSTASTHEQILCPGRASSLPTHKVSATVHCSWNEVVVHNIRATALKSESVCFTHGAIVGLLRPCKASLSYAALEYSLNTKTLEYSFRTLPYIRKATIRSNLPRPDQICVMQARSGFCDAFSRCRDCTWIV